MSAHGRSRVERAVVEFRPGLLVGFLVSTGLDYGPLL
jgi:hypothetical protein